MNKSYYELFEEYLRQCPWAESMVVNWEPKGDMKILVELNDGSWMTYDGVYKILRSSHDKSRLYDTPSDYEEWRHISGQRLDRWLTMHDVSRSAVTDVLDVSQPTLVRYLNGDRPLPAYIVYLIAKHFCMSDKDLSYILCVTDE